MRRKIMAIGIAAAMAMCSIYGCSSSSDTGNGLEQDTAGSAGDTEAGGTQSVGVKFDVTSEDVEENMVTVAVSMGGELTGEGADTIVESTASNTIYLKGDSIECEASSVTVSGTTATIKNAGTYIVTGTLDDGQIAVDTEDKGTVWIILSNANITSNTNSPVYVVNAKKTIISAATGTENTLSDAKEYTYAVTEDEEPNACIFSKDDLVISGDGSLTVNGNFNNGIASKDTLEIVNINLTVNAENNGIKGKDYLVIKGGDITVDAKGDGLKSDNTDDSSLGYILIQNGNINITAGEDGIQAETCLKIEGGNINVDTGDGASVVSNNDMWGGGNTSSDTSIKGIKAGVDITITKGTININSEDDSIHSNGTIEISGGSIEAASRDDGIHSDTELVINEGEINITKSYEGIESVAIIINGGYITVCASDDGINAAGGNDGSSQSGRPGMNDFSSSTGSVEINGGYIYLNADGDGLDSNGSVTVTDGTILIDGPENSGNGALDYTTEFNMSGGLLVAAGSSGMMQTVSTTSSQYCISVVTTAYQSKNTLFNISDSEGNSILTYMPSKKYNSVVICSPDIIEGETYTVSCGGETTGEDDGNGFYTDGSYSGGDEVGSVTISQIINQIGSGGGMNGGDIPGGNGGGMHGGRPDRMN